MTNVVEVYPEGAAATSIAGRRSKQHISFNDRLAAYFRAHEGEWVNARELFFAGSMGWRTRISNCRREFGMAIENRIYRRETAPGCFITCSEYRYVRSSQEAP
jgi:hypothetical protein